MKKVIVTTTIHPLTPALNKFQWMKDWHLIVVGDKKTPRDFRLERGTYVSPAMQEEFDRELSEAVGWDCIQRRNFGLLWAKEMGADIIALVDDDNYPHDDWGRDLMINREVEVNFHETDLPAFDPIGATNHRELWHRGFPLPLISQRRYGEPVRRYVRPSIQADFWNGDPDIDAFCRMEHAPECRFDDAYFPFSSNRIAPFNSQNTFLCASLLPDYFLFPHVGRMDDIWAAYYVQAKGAKVVFGKASVTQTRNPHDAIRDMKAEFLGYEHNLEITAKITESDNVLLQLLPESSKRAFSLYRRHFKRH